MKMTKSSDSQYSPLMQAEWSDGDEEHGVMNGKRGKPRFSSFSTPFSYDESRGRMKPLHIFLIIVSVIGVGAGTALIAGAIFSAMNRQPQPPPPSVQQAPAISPQPLPQSSSPKSPATPEITKLYETYPDTPTHVVRPSPPPHVKSDKNWRLQLKTIGSESCVRTPDIDGDGLPDVLIGLATDVDLDVANSIDGENSLKKYCEDRNRTYPCVGFLLALRGYDGKELWRIPTRSEVIFITCDLDLNGDGNEDCVVSGRQSVSHAIDLRNGKTLWYADGTNYPSHFVQMWNLYQPVSLEVDVNGDGISEILIAHGGNPNIPEDVHDRESGRLIVLSGATGQPMGEYLELPDKKETYMSPVIYTDHDGSRYVIFGSGGETVPGDLMALSMPDFFKAVKIDVKKEFPGSFAWKNFLEHNSDIMVLHRGPDKGVMVPPVIIDIDNDGMDDILVSVFDGSLIMLDGRTMKPKWTIVFPNSESYSTPAPGYFDADEYLDFMVHNSLGDWPEYNQSTVDIVSGKDGSILWSDTRPLYVMSSDLILRSQEHRKDYFMVKMRGQASGVGSVSRSEAHGIGAQRNITKRSVEGTKCAVMEEDYRRHHMSCKGDLTKETEDIYLISRELQGKPQFIKSLKPQRLTYSFHVESPEKSCVPVDSNGRATLCSVMVPLSRSTDAVTDVDNDGRLDLINVGILEARLRDSRYSYSEMEYNTIISRVDMETVVNKPTNTKNMFAPYSAQPWLEYLGSQGNSIYRRYNGRSN